MDPGSAGFLPGYDGTIDVGWLMFLVARLAVALFLVSSALTAYDRKALNGLEIAVRLAVAALIMVRPAEVYGPALAAGAGVIALHLIRSRYAAQPQ